MLKKYTWIVAAFVTLAMVFSFAITGCDDGRDMKYGKVTSTEPLFRMSTNATIQAIADGTKFSNNSSDWLRRSGANGHITFEDFGTIGIMIINDQPDATNTVEIRTNSLKDFYKEGYSQRRPHTISVSGYVYPDMNDAATPASRTVSFARMDGTNYPGTSSTATVNGDNSFSLTRQFTWAELSNTAQPAIRLNFGARTAEKIAEGETLVITITQIIISADLNCGCTCAECLALPGCGKDGVLCTDTMCDCDCHPPLSCGCSCPICRNNGDCGTDGDGCSDTNCACDCHIPTPPGTVIYNFNTGDAGLDVLGLGSVWWTSSGSPGTFSVTKDGDNNISFNVAGRGGNDWATAEFRIETNATSFTANGAYTITITGTTDAGTTVRSGIRAHGGDNSPAWSNSVTATDGTFTLTHVITKSGPTFTMPDSGSNPVPLFSLRMLTSVTTDYTITGLTIVKN